MKVIRCVKCMEDMSNVSGTVCPCCGFDNSGAAEEQPPYAMRRNTILRGRYLVGNVLGQGGFGITYIGFDLVLNVKIAIKEYYPMGIVMREQSKSNTVLWNTTHINTEQRQSGYESFLKEARKTAKIDQIPSIVRVRDTFFENETAYIVMDFVEGITLKNKLLKEGVMSITECIALLTPMMEGLAQVHKMGIIHRDISPDNIMIQPNGKVKLLDLGAAKDMSVGEGHQSQLVTKKGFSPIEQYTETGQIGPWTDVYALCATIYYCITGKMVPTAIDRMSNAALSFPATMKEPLSAAAEAALKAGLAVETKNRIRSMDELLERLQGEKAGVSKDEPKKKRFWEGKKRPVLIGAAAVFLISVIALFAGGNKGTSEKNITNKTAAVTESGAETEAAAMGSSVETETDAVVVEKLGTDNANLLNYGVTARFEKEYRYYIAGDNALYVCPYDKENETFYLGDDEKICDSAGYITLSDDAVYFLATINDRNAVCRVNKDGSGMEQIYSIKDEGKSFRYLQYVRFSDAREYLYFVLETNDAMGTGNLYRYNLQNNETETVVEGELVWYNLYGNAVYYTIYEEENNYSYSLKKAGLDGENEEILDSEKNVVLGFAAEDALYMLSFRDETILAYNLDGTLKEGVDGFYNISIDTTRYFGYGDGWIYYTDASDNSIHHVRVNGTGDEVFFEGHTAMVIGYSDSWVWFIEDRAAESDSRYERQLNCVYRDGTHLMTVSEPDYVWKSELAYMLETAPVADFQYEESEDGEGVVITAYTGKLTSFTIPEMIDDKPVVGIADHAFEESSLQEIGLPETVRSIGEKAFCKSSALTFVGLPEGLEEIAYGAFGGCKGLTGIELPESLRVVGNAAFMETSISEVYIPANLEDIGVGAFAVWDDSGLTEFTISEENKWYVVQDGILYFILDENRLLLQEVPADYSSSFVMPDNTVGILSYAFAHCRKLTEVDIPESVIVIFENAFRDVGFSEITVNKECDLPEDLGDELEVKYY